MLWVLALATNALLPSDAPPALRQNVVLVMTDDQGLGDFSNAGHGGNVNVRATTRSSRPAYAHPNTQSSYSSSQKP